MKNKAFAVMKWEFNEKVRSKAFLISLLLMPVIIVLFGVLPGLLAGKPDDESIAIGIVDDTNNFFTPLAKKIEEKYKLPSGAPNYVLRNIESTGDIENTKKAAINKILFGKIQGCFLIPANVYDSGKVEYRARNVGNFRILSRFERTFEEVISEYKLIKKGLSPQLVKEVQANIDIRSMKIDKKGKETESGFLETFYTSYIFIMMLLFLVLTSGQLLIRSFVEEKSNRVIEVLLSSATSNELMVGKILGLSALGLVQVGVWMFIALGLAIQTGINFVMWEGLLISLIYFVLGHLMYSAIFIGAGSPVTTEQEAQQLTTYLSLILVFPIVLAMPAMQNPDSTLIKVLSFIPLFTPSFMLLRIPIQMPAMWEIVTTVLLLLISNIICMWAAAKIFRLAILSYGKRPSLKELYVWIRTP